MGICRLATRPTIWQSVQHLLNAPNADKSLQNRTNHKGELRDCLAVARQHGLERHPNFTNGRAYARNRPRIALSGTARLLEQAVRMCFDFSVRLRAT